MGELHYWFDIFVGRASRLLSFIPEPWNRFALYAIAIAILVSLLTFLMKLWQRIKPKPSIEEIQTVKGKHARSVRKEARWAEKSGNWLAAGDAWNALGNHRRALELYRKAGAFDRAGELLLNEGRTNEAITMWENAGLYAMAAKHLAKAGQYERAASNYAKANNPSQAAEMYERAAKHEQAGDSYSKAGFHLKAASNYSKAGATLPAAKSYEKYFLEQAVHLSGSLSPEREKGIRELAKRSGGLYQRAGKLDQAAQILIRGGFHLEAAKIVEELGETDRAAKLYEEAGRHDEAARLLVDSDDQRAMSVKAEALRSQGKLTEAAEAYSQAGDYSQAADLLAREGKSLEAAQMLLQAGSYADAANLFLQGDDKAGAAKAYEAARDFDSSLEIYQQIGDIESSIRVLIKAERRIEAAKQLHKLRRPQDAYRLLQELTSEDEGFGEACLMMAQLHAGAGRVDTAIQIIQKGIRGEGVEHDNIELYYALGRLFEQRRDYLLAQDIYSKILAENIGYKDTTIRHQQIRDQLAQTAVPPQGAQADHTMVSQEPAGARENPRYNIIEELGRGGMGVVYKALDTALDRHVAYKVLPPDMKNHPNVIESFGREAKALAALHHPNIVMVFDAGGMGGEYYFVMEYIDGKNLKDVVRTRGAFPIEEALQIFRELAGALEYAHNRKIAHRDIKTSNVMMTDDNHVKLMDFGLAKVLGEAVAGRTAVSGTPYYMSPEQTLGEGVDHRTDIYSLGVMIYELATGQVPFKQGDIGYHHLHTDPTSPSSIRPDTPQTLEAIILKCMKKKKEDRYQTAAEILEDLKSIDGKS